MVSVFHQRHPQPLSGHRAFATCLEATAQRREGAVDRWDRIGNVGMFRTGVGDFLNANWGGVFLDMDGEKGFDFFCSILCFNFCI